MTRYRTHAISGPNGEALDSSPAAAKQSVYEAREALQLASVIGREFTVRLLDRISEANVRLEGVLAELRGLELIYEKSYIPELSYMFKHALTHDVAYSTLLEARRRALHRVVAAATATGARAEVSRVGLRRAPDWLRGPLARSLLRRIGEEPPEEFVHRIVLVDVRERECSGSVGRNAGGRPNVHDRGSGAIGEIGEVGQCLHCRGLGGRAGTEQGQGDGEQRHPDGSGKSADHSVFLFLH